MKLRQKLEILLSVARLERTTFYYHHKQMKKPDKYAQAKEEVTSIFHENKGRYGYRRIKSAIIAVPLDGVPVPTLIGDSPEPSSFLLHQPRQTFPLQR